MSTELITGAIVAGRYRLERLIEEGGMGVVWAAMHIDAQMPVALKFLRQEVASEAATRRRAFREARAAGAVRHPNVVQIHELLELDDGAPVLVMDLLKGESLRARLNRQPQLPLEDLTRTLLPVISAAGTAHALGIIHRDLKPENIFLAEQPDGSHEVKVLDFGIAKLLVPDNWHSQSTAGSAGILLGTPYYMSPEQIFGESDIDHRTDIWSLGIILYEGLTGKRPTEAENVGKVLRLILTNSIIPLGKAAPHLPDELKTLVDQMLVYDRNRRLSDLREAGRVLEGFAHAPLRPFDAPRISAVPASPLRGSASDGQSSIRLLPEGNIALSANQNITPTLDVVMPVPDRISNEPMAKGGETLASPRLVSPSPPAPPPRWPRLLHALGIAVAGVILVIIGFLGARFTRSSQREAAASMTPWLPAPDPPESGPCGRGMRLIAGGSATMGAEDGRPDERPIHPITVESFCLDRTEVTVAFYLDCVRAGHCRAPSATVSWRSIAADTQERDSRYCLATQNTPNAPMNCVNWEEADNFCKASGRRLPTEIEWEYAASGGGEHRLYPWGSTPPAPTLLNACDRHCADTLLHGKQNRTFSGLFDNDGHGTLAPVGSYPKGAAAAGVLDMAGNVWEWTASAYCRYPDHGCTSPYRVFRGGGWATDLVMNLRTTARFSSAPDHRYKDVGFRCAKDLPKSP